MIKEELAQIAKETGKVVSEESIRSIKENIVPDLKVELSEEVTKKVMNEVGQQRNFGKDQKEKAEKEEFVNNLRSIAKGEKQSFSINTRNSTDHVASTQDVGSGKELTKTGIAKGIIMPNQKKGLVDQYAYHYPMSADIEPVSTIDAVLAQRSNEKDLRSFGGLKTGVVNLHAATLSAIVPVTRELVDNSIQDIGSIFSILGGRAISLLRDKWALGLLDPNEGITNNENVQKHILTGNKFSNLKHDDLITSYGMLGNEAENPIAIFHRSVAANLMKEKTANGNYVWDWSLANRKKLGFGGIDYELSSLLPGMATAEVDQAGKEFATLADFGSVVHGIAQTVEIQRADQAILSNEDGKVLLNAYQQRMYFYMISVREDIVLYKPNENFVTIKTAAS